MLKSILKSILMALFFFAMSNYATAQIYSGAGIGTASSPYLITSAAQLNEVRIFMGGGNHFRLENNIDLTDYLSPGGDGFLLWGIDGWGPIGDNSTNDYRSRFEGNFDGNGKKITGLWINRPLEDHVGLFGAFSGVNAKIHNLCVEIAPQGIKGKNTVGGLVGGAYSNATITKVYTTGGPVSGTDNVGGLLGEVITNIHITNAYSNCKVNGNFYIGGLVGIANTSTFTNIYATGSVSGNQKLGGLVGVITKVNISYAYATGTVSGTSYVGGLVGDTQDNSSVINCVVANGSITATDAGALVNRISSRGISGSYFRSNYCVGSGMTLSRGGADITASITDDLNDLQGEGRILAQLQTFDFYNGSANWDGGAWGIALDNSLTWNILNGSSFPFLQWQYDLRATTLTSFGSLFVDYATQPASQTVTITNEGLCPVTFIQPVSANYDIGALSTTTLNSKGETTTFTICPKIGLAAGTYNETIIISCIEGFSISMNVSFTVEIAIPSHIVGPENLTLYEGYSATSTNAFTITGSTPIMVEKLYGNSHISWNNSSNTLDIAEGLLSGTYIVQLRAANGFSTYGFTFTLTVEKRYYTLDCPTIKGGAVLVSTDNSNSSLALEGATITLKILPDDEYELDEIKVYLLNNSWIVDTNVVIPLSGTGLDYTFTMPAHHVSISAIFKQKGVGIETIHVHRLKAFAQNDKLYVSGLETGKMLSIHNMNGTLIYQGIVNSGEMEVFLSGRGVYIIRNNNNTVKVVN